MAHSDAKTRIRKLLAPATFDFCDRMSGKKKGSSKKSANSKKLKAVRSASAAAQLDFDLASTPADDLLNQSLFDDESVEAYRRKFLSGSPFPHLFIKDICNSDFLHAVKQELQNEKFVEKSNDLYDFLQTGDLKSNRQLATSKLREALYGAKFRKFLSTVTGIELNDVIDMSSAIYRDTDKLLCHDDELEGRRIAFIMYLVPEEWEASNGGALDLFDVEPEQLNNADNATSRPSTSSASATASATAAEQLQQPSGLIPSRVVKSLTPQWNSFAFFEVSTVSFHQVAEVMSKQHKRMSVVGWFHGEPVYRANPIAADAPLPFGAPRTCASATAVGTAAASFAASEVSIESSMAVLKEWISPTYLKPKTIAQVRQAFVQQSSITLFDFLKADKYAAVLKAMESSPTPAGKQQIPSRARANEYLNVKFDQQDAQADDEDENGDDDDDEIVSSSSLPSSAASTTKSSSSLNSDSSISSPWMMTGPPNKRHYWKYDLPNLFSSSSSTAATIPKAAEKQTKNSKKDPKASAKEEFDSDDGGANVNSEALPMTDLKDLNVVQRCARLLCSAEFALLIEELTGLVFTEVCDPEIRKFNHGCYTLGHDQDPGLTQPGLDVCLTFAPTASRTWQSDKWGGHTQYLDSEEALLAFDPLPNQLSLVFRGEPGAFKFVKYMNHRAPVPRYDMECSFHINEELMMEMEMDEDDE